MTGYAALTEVFKGDDPLVEYGTLRHFLERIVTLSSIVAVHGLNGDAFKTWTTKNTRKFWLGDADLLPANLKRARILTYSYDAAVTSLFGKTSSDRILQHAHSLVAELVADRE
ncbi:MAG: hypothetical protein Q9187_007413, partial [Circinaria calcarea]